MAQVNVHAWHYNFVVCQKDANRKPDRWNVDGFYKHLLTTKPVDDPAAATKQYEALRTAFPTPDYKIVTQRTPNLIQSMEDITPALFTEEA